MKKVLLLYPMMLVAAAAKSQWAVDSLNTARAGIPVAVFGNKLVFGSGSGNSWDIFDVNSNVHTAGLLSFSRTNIAFAQTVNYAYFGGGKYGPYADPLYTKNVDVYNNATNTWSVANLSIARQVGGAGSIAEKVFFAGGLGRDFGGPVYLYNRVDIFNSTTGVRTIAKLSKARSNIAVASAADKILFAGGWFWDITYNQLQSNVVDIYNNTTGLWSKAMLSRKRESMGVAVVGNKILFAGGYAATGSFQAAKTVDIYDALTGAWTVTYFSKGRYSMVVSVVGGKAYFAGGNGAADNSIEVYDAATNTWSNLMMPVTLKGYTATVVGDNIYYAGGYNAANRVSAVVQMYNTNTQVWSLSSLSQPRYNIAVAGTGGKVFFAGGYKDLAYPLATLSNRIDIYTSALTAVAGSRSALIVQYKPVPVYPNPAKNYVIIAMAKQLPEQSEITVIDVSGVVRYTKIIGTDKTIKLPVTDLAAGVYFFRINSGKEILDGKFVKE
jgi:Secretion system C-terminal sorting domain/Kelch motif